MLWVLVFIVVLGWVYMRKFLLETDEYRSNLVPLLVKDDRPFKLPSLREKVMISRLACVFFVCFCVYVCMCALYRTASMQ
jgi:hypothetical protein